MALTEWKLTPEYINRMWTEELMALMFMKRNQRLTRMSEAVKSVSQQADRPSNLVSNETFFSRHGIKVQEH